eukprot:g4191.t1
MTPERLLHDYWLQGVPVLVRGLIHDWPAATKDYRFKEVIDAFGDQSVQVSSIPYAIKFSGAGRTQRTIGEYALQMREHTLVGGQHPWYIFKGHPIEQQNANKSLVPESIVPVPRLINEAADLHARRTGSALRGRQHWLNRQWAMGGPGTGAPVHFHNLAWNALVFGAKKWYLFPPRARVMSNRQIFDFVQTDLEDLRRARVEPSRPRTCVQTAGDVIFIPEAWGHGVLNLQEGVAVATEMKSAMHAPKWPRRGIVEAMPVPRKDPRGRRNRKRRRHRGGKGGGWDHGNRNHEG